MINLNEIVQRLFFSKSLWFLRHFFYWIIIYLDEFLALIGLTAPFEEPYSVFISFLFDVVLVYINLYILMPKFLYKSKLTPYLFYTFLSILVIVAINILIIENAMTEDYSKVDYLTMFIQSGVLTLGVLAPAVALKIIKWNWTSLNKLNDLKRSQLQSELELLKKQVNPHFLFNTLNSIYVQSKENSENLPSTIFALSELMRYQSYDGLQEYVSILKELEFIDNYLKMESMRRDNLEVKVSIDKELQGLIIEPLLLLPLIENACKYSQTTNQDIPSFIHVNVKKEKENLIIAIENSIGENLFSNQKHSGIGLNNVQQRLALLYKKNHEIEIQETKEKYTVRLTLKSKTYDEVYHS